MLSWTTPDLLSVTWEDADSAVKIKMNATINFFILNEVFNKFKI
jgi:hypothetical protein